MSKQRHNGSTNLVPATTFKELPASRVVEHSTLQRLVFLAAGVFLLFILFRLIKSVLAERPSYTPAVKQSAPQVAQSQKAPPQFVPRKKQTAGNNQVVKSGLPASSAPGQDRPKRSSRRELGEKLLLAAEITAVLLFVGAGIAFWDTLTDVNNTYRALQRADARALPTIIPAANPGLAFEALAQRSAEQQEVALLPPLNSIGAPALPTPYPTTAPPATPVIQPTSSAQWGTTAVMQKQAPELEQETSRRIQIPAIGVDSFVYQNYGDDWLKLGVVQFGQYVAPGEAGNLVLAAHNDIYGEIFRDLDRLQAGDEVVILGDRSGFTYRVRETLVVEPTETWVMLPTSKPTLTLISCYPYLIGSQRIVVFADYVQ